MVNSACIWCLTESNDTDDEHIIPQVLGCPEDFVLPGSIVCRSCNNKLAHLDQALADEYDLLTFASRVPGRNGKRPAVRRRGNVVATLEKTGPVTTINMEPHSVRAHDGTIAGAYRARHRNINATFEIAGTIARIKFNVTFGSGPKFVRGITKVAFSFLAFFIGDDEVRAAKYDSVRKFVIAGEGCRHVTMFNCGNQKYQSGPASLHVLENNDYIIEFRIGQTIYFIDLSESEAYLPAIKQSMADSYGNRGWCLMPIDKSS